MTVGNSRSTHRPVLLTEDECKQRLAEAPVGRIAFLWAGMPVIVPVNFKWHEGSIVFRTQEGQKLTGSQGRPVSFEIDDWDSARRTGWSVVVKGLAAEVTQWAAKEQLEQIGLTPWTNEVWRRRWVEVLPIEITGIEIATDG